MSLILNLLIKGVKGNNQLELSSGQGKDTMLIGDTENEIRRPSWRGNLENTNLRDSDAKKLKYYCREVGRKVRILNAI